MTQSAAGTKRVRVGDTEVPFIDLGTGSPVVVLHGMRQLDPGDRFLAALARRAHVLAPAHPGFGGTELPDWLDSVCDLAYHDRAFLRAMQLEAVTLVGLSLGGWVAAELATQCTRGLRALVLVDALGIKTAGCSEAQILDVFGVGDRQLAMALYADPTRAERPSEMTDPELEIFVRDREASALLMWEPYAHDPKLFRRLGMIDVPTLVVWGRHDGVVDTAYGRSYAEAIPGARFTVLDGAGHLPHVEQPERLADEVLRFLPIAGTDGH